MKMPPFLKCAQGQAHAIRSKKNLKKIVFSVRIGFDCPVLVFLGIVISMKEQKTSGSFYAPCIGKIKVLLKKPNKINIKIGLK